MAIDAIGSRVAVHAALADPYRLRIVDELVLSDRSPSDLGGSLEIGSNLLAHHLRILEDAGLIERLPSAGDGRRKYLRLVPSGLTGMIEPLSPLFARHVLFVCTANSARSQLAAAAWNSRHEVLATSAGTKPAPAVRSEAVKAAARRGLDLTHARPRSLDQVTEAPDLVITVCDVAHEELRTLSGRPTLLHWSIPDPARARSRSAFDDALGAVVNRVNRTAPHVYPARSRRRARR